MKLRVKKLHKDAKLPKRSYSTDSGLDVFSIENVTILPGKKIPIHTGIAIQLPKPAEVIVYSDEPGVAVRQTFIWECQVRPRSGLARDYGITILNTPGTIDNSYRGEVVVMLKNHSEIPFKVTKGMKIAQLVIAPVIAPILIEVDELDDTERGGDGFGSTGV